MGKSLPSFTICRDSREQQGWDFEAGKRTGCFGIDGTIIKKLDAGDYSIIGLEDIVTIERKNGFSELFGNMSPKTSKERFEREMERMREIPHKYIVIESSVSKDIARLSVPQMRAKVPVSKIMEWLMELSVKYDVQPIYAGDCGKRIAMNIFQHVARKYLL